MIDISKPKNLMACTRIELKMVEEIGIESLG